MTSSVSRYVVAGRASWSRETFDRHLAGLEGSWSFVATDEELTSALAELAPRYVFFLHWSTIVPPPIVAAYECVCFHMTAVPYGRGGSPLQNLILRGHTETVVTALRMTEEVDAGPVYGSRPLALLGSAEEIFLRAGDAAAELVAWMVAEEPEPEPQVGQATSFTRRRPDQSRIERSDDLDALHDFIRMLDADGYPHAFLDHDGYRYTFRRATRSAGHVEAHVVITPSPEEAP